MGAYTTDRIRLLLSKNGTPVDQITGAEPSFNVGTDIQFELSDTFLGALIDGSQIASITFAIKPASNEDAAAIISATVTPSSTGWNSNPCYTSGNQLVPGYATYSSAGTGASATATISGTAVNGYTSLVGGTGYTVAPTIFVVGGGGSGAAFTATISGGIVTGLTLVSGGTGYSSAPTLLFQPPPSSCVLGVQAGATYSWEIGENDLTLSNTGTNVTGSNLVPVGAAYTAGSYTLTGLTTGAYYYFTLGANDTSVNAVVAGAAPFFKAPGTSVTILGTGTSLVTAQVYPAAIGSNLVPGSVVYPTTTLVATGASPAAGVTIPSNYVAGAATITGLTPGTTYAYTMGVNDLTFNGVSTASSQGGLFTPTSSTVLITGTGTNTVTVKVYATIGSTASYILNNLTAGVSYYYTLNSDTSVNGLTAATGFFIAIAGQVTLKGPGGNALTATVQAMSQVTTGSFVAAGNSVTFTGTPGLPVTAQLTGNVGWTNSSDQLCVIPFANSQTNLSTPDGGQTTYWILITAVTTAGNKLVLGSGNVIAEDNGQPRTGTPQSGNLVPLGAIYSASTGSGASVTATVAGGAVTGFTGLSGGTLYSATAPPVIVFSGGGGLGASAVATVVGGIVTAVTLTSGGTGYSSAPTISFATSSYGLTVVPGFAYYWRPGANDSGAPGLSAVGTFVAGSTTAILTGTGADAVTATVYAVNTYPWRSVTPLNAGQTSLVISTLNGSFIPMGGRCTIMIPAGGTPVDAPLEYSTLGAAGGTFLFNIAIPATGYVALWEFL